MGATADGANVLLAESKFWAPLTPNQPTGYLERPCVTIPLSQGVNPKFVPELLGNADIKLTLGTYMHFLPSMGDRTATAMESALG